MFYQPRGLRFATTSIFIFLLSLSGLSNASNHEIYFTNNSSSEISLDIYIKHKAYRPKDKYKKNKSFSCLANNNELKGLLYGKKRVEISANTENKKIVIREDIAPCYKPGFLKGGIGIKVKNKPTVYCENFRSKNGRHDNCSWYHYAYNESKDGKGQCSCIKRRK